MKAMQSKTCIFSLFLFLAFFFSADAQTKPPPLRGAKAYQIVTVNPKPGKANFTTIGAAVAAAPINLSPSTGYYVISIAAGVYPEYISIAFNQMYIMMIGAGINKTIITGNKNTVDGAGTYGSATFAVVGQGFVAQKITFRNTAGPAKMQAVAVRNEADMSAFYLCSFEGYQATLYAFSNKQFYRGCDIYGTVDIVFGNAAAVFQKCNIYPRLPLPGQFNTITAQNRNDVTQNTGFSFQNCSITAAPDLASSNGQTQTYLGRNWGAYSRTVFMETYMGRLINPAGWAAYSNNATALTTLYYAEFANSGPGSVLTNRVKWSGFHVINAATAAAYTVANFINGKLWLPTTGLPYSPGLH